MSRGETEIMDVPPEGQVRDMIQDVPPNMDNSEDPSTQAEQSRATEECTESCSEEAPSSDRMGQESTDQSLTEDISANENCFLIPHHASTPNHTVRTEAPTRQSSESSLQNGHALPSGVANGSLPICTPPSVSTGHPGWLSSQSPKCNSPVHPDKKRLPSTSTNSQHSLKTTATQIQQVAGDDLCASIVLACLFCQLWDCLLAVGEGCQLCVSSLCSSLCSSVCCCNPAVLEPLLVESPFCCEECLGPHCCNCSGPGFDCSICDICLQATECLDLGMEISQLLFH